MSVHLVASLPGRPAALDRASPLPLWAQLLDDLRRRLAEAAGDAGDAGVDAGPDGHGEPFPSELELAAEYGVSRNTVREAMRRLRADGTVVAGRGRRPHLGTPIRQSLGAFYSLFESVRAAGLEQQSVVRRLERSTDASVAQRLGLEPAAALVHFERLRLAGGEPLAIDRIWLPAASAEAMLGADLTDRGFYEELARLTGIRLTRGEEQLRAVLPSRSLRRQLHMPASAAAFAIERMGRVGEEPFEWRTTLVRGDRFSVVAEFADPPSG
jgi:GntR family transcriptional regulator